MRCYEIVINPTLKMVNGITNVSGKFSKGVMVVGVKASKFFFLVIQDFKVITIL